jgi:hypothetical protein
MWAPLWAPSLWELQTAMLMVLQTEWRSGWRSVLLVRWLGRASLEDTCCWVPSGMNEQYEQQQQQQQQQQQAAGNSSSTKQQ